MLGADGVTGSTAGLFHLNRKCSSTPVSVHFCGDRGTAKGVFYFVWFIGIVLLYFLMSEEPADHGQVFPSDSQRQVLGPCAVLLMPDFAQRLERVV